MWLAAFWGEWAPSVERGLGPVLALLFLGGEVVVLDWHSAVLG